MSKHIGRFHITEGKFVRWNSNCNIPPKECLADMYCDGEITHEQHEYSNAQRHIEQMKTLENYREQMKNHVPDAEEMFEMRAAFGAGETVVNIITGQRYQL